MRKITFTFFAFLLVFTAFAIARAQSGSCFSQSGTISANIQVFNADKVDEPVVFSASNSTGIGDFFKEPIDWDFGDGFKAKMCRATHVYRNPGTYTVSLTVRNNVGTPNTVTTQVTIAAIPAATGSNVLTVVTNGSGNGTTTFNTVQAAVDRAATLNGSGTVEIIIPAGAAFVENVVLKVPVGNNYITLRSSALGNLPVGQRATRTNLSNFATIKSPLNSTSPALSTELKGPGGGACGTGQTCSPAHHYRLQGIQFMVDPGTLSGFVYETIMAIGTDDSTQNEDAEQAHHFIMDRCLVYREDYSASNTNPQAVKNGLESNAKNLSVVDSNFTGINAPGTESHAMTAYNSTGVWGIINNYFEAGSINLLIGGALPSIPGAIVTDVEFRRNRNHKPLSKRDLPVDHRWTAKNNFELKSARYWTIDENLFDGNWIGSNQRWTVQFVAFTDTNPIPQDRDHQFTRNIIRNGPAGLLMGRDAIPDSTLFGRFLVSNNLLTDLGGTIYGTPGCHSSDCQGEGQGLGLTTVPTSVIFRHNTILVKKTLMEMSGSSNQAISYKDNISNHGEIYGDGWGYGIKGDGAGVGCSSIDPALSGCDNIQAGIPYLQGSVFDKNVLAGTIYDNRFTNNVPYPYQTANYYFPTQTPANPTGFSNINNHFVSRATGNYRIADGTPGKNGASDGTDVGANIDQIDVVAANAVSGIWGTVPPVTQTPYPGPSAPNIPLTLEAENFDSGGQGLAYNEIGGSTGSGAYRSNPVETVDVQARTTASNGFEVFETSAGEWMEYTVNVPFTRKYDIGIRYANAFSNGQVRIEDCGSNPNNNSCTDITGLMTLPQTHPTAWNTFRVVTKRGVTLSAGQHTLRLVMVTNSTGGCNCVVADFDAILFKPALFDYDNDGRADVSVFRPSNSTWFFSQSTAGFGAVTFGTSGDIITPGDFDGDGKADIAIFRPSTGVWWILQSSNLQLVTAAFGVNGDIPVQGDYDNDGKTDVAIWRPSSGTWYVINSSNGSNTGGAFGTNGDRPAVGDYDGDGKNDFAIFRPATGTWWILNSSSSAVSAVAFGLSSDKITPADFDADGRTDIALFRPSDNTWHRLNSTNGQYVAFTFGVSGDLPATADYDGDGKVDAAVFRPSNGIWYISRSTEGYTEEQFGLNGDIPTPSTYVR